MSSTLLRITLVLLGIVFISTLYYAYNINKTTVSVPIQPEPTTKPEPIKKLEDEIIPNNYMCNVAVAIYTAPPHADTRVASARKSWTKRICPYGTPQYMFIGLPAELKVERSIDVPCPADYFSLCCKSMEGLAALYKTYPNADWYYKVDDDTILVPHNVDELLKEHDPNDKVLLGYAIEAVIDKDTKEFHAQIGQIYEDSIFYCSGSGYIMSRGLVHGMMTNMSHYKEVWSPICDMYDAEDVAVGLFAAKFGARVEKIFGVYNKGWNWEEGPNDDEHEVVSVHLSRNTDKMILYDRLLSGVTPKVKPAAKQKRSFKMFYEN